MPGMVGPNRDEQEPDFLSAAARRRELRGGGKRRDMGREQRGETLGERRGGLLEQSNLSCLFLN